jgi:hypothetical protein
VARVGGVDIGAFELRGFTITVQGGGQAVPINSAFQPLTVLVASAFGEPVAGGVLTFTGPAAGAGVHVLPPSAIISTGGVVSLSVFANEIAGGPYRIIITAAGASAVSFTLTNLALSLPPQGTSTPSTGPAFPTGTVSPTGALPAGSLTTHAPARAVFAVGADAGGGPQINVYDVATGSLIASFFGLPSTFTGGVRVAVGDVNGDGTPDIVCAAGPGAGPQITVFDGKTFQAIQSFFGLPVSFTGGAFVAVGDVNQDGFADIIVSADPGGGPQVTITSGKDGTQLASFYATAANFTGGIRVAAGGHQRRWLRRPHCRCRPGRRTASDSFRR